MSEQREKQSNPDVFVIDDDPLWVEVLVKKCKDAGLSTAHELDSVVGFDEILRQHPKVILLDIRMPKMDGIELLRNLRKDSWGKDARVVLLTSLEQDDELLQATNELSPAYYIEKDEQSLDNIVEKVQELK